MDVMRPRKKVEKTAPLLSKSKTHNMRSLGKMGSQAAPLSSFLSPFSCYAFLSSNSSKLSYPSPFLLPLKHVNSFKTHITHIPCLNSAKFFRETRATLDEKENDPFVVQEQLPEFEESVKVLKNAAKTRKVSAVEVLSAFSVIEKAKINPSGFLETLGGSDSPGRTWMLIFTAEKQLKGGRYFPLTAVQRFDATARKIENGVFLGPIGFLTFEGRFSWKNRILSFIFERIRVKIGPFNPLEISLGQKGDREPNTKDPFFIWFYIDEEIAVAKGRSGGTAFWCRCHCVTT